MELGCAQINRLFVPQEEQINKYYSEQFDIYETRSLNNLWTFGLQIKDGDTVLDVGCAQGKQGEALEGKQCKLYGIELDQVAAEIAMKTDAYEDIAVSDACILESESIQRIIKDAGGFDVIIFSDILEHLLNPTDILVKYVGLLNKDGKVLISVPNIGHADIILNLLNGRFNYSDIGIMDNTHLKFFTKKSFVQWIAQINTHFEHVNLECKFLGTVYYNNDYLENIKKNYNELYKILQCNPNYLGLTFMFELIKKETQEDTPSLKKLLDEEDATIVEYLGKGLKGENIYIDNSQVERGQRLWYETQFEELEHLKRSNIELLEERKKKDIYISEIEINCKATNDELQNSKKYIKELENRVENARECIINIEGRCSETNTELQKTKKYVKELEQTDQRKNKYINMLESNCRETNDELLKAKEYINKLENNCRKTNDELLKAKEYINKLENNYKETNDELLKAKEYINELENKERENVSYIDVLKKLLEARDEYIYMLEKANSEYVGENR